MEKKLEYLLLNKKFSDLTPEERYYITEHLSEAEFNNMQATLINSKNALKNTPSVNPKMKEKLLAAYREQHNIKEENKSGLIIRLMSYKMPAWQVAAAIALLLGFSFGSRMSRK